MGYPHDSRNLHIGESHQTWLTWLLIINLETCKSSRLNSLLEIGSTLNGRVLGRKELNTWQTWQWLYTIHHLTAVRFPSLLGARKILTNSTDSTSLIGFKPQHYALDRSKQNTQDSSCRFATIVPSLGPSFSSWAGPRRPFPCKDPGVATASLRWCPWQEWARRRGLGRCGELETLGFSVLETGALHAESRLAPWNALEYLGWLGRALEVGLIWDCSF